MGTTPLSLSLIHIFINLQLYKDSIIGAYTLFWDSILETVHEGEDPSSANAKTPPPPLDVYKRQIGGRYAHEGAIEGVFYKNISYMLGAEKVWDRGKHRLSVITFGSPVELSLIHI